MSTGATLPEYLPLGDTKAASGDITRHGSRVTEGQILWYVTLEAM